MESKKIKLLGVFDHVIATGFSTVSHNILKNLPSYKYDLAVIGVNYYGDPNGLPYRVYPAQLGGDVYGIGRLQDVCNKEKPDIIFIINDAWIVDNYLAKIKEIYQGKTLPKVVVYFPVDAKDHDPDWYKNFDIVTPVVYNQFGYDVATKAMPDLNPRIISHGVDTKSFYQYPESRLEVKKRMYPDRPDYYDSFIVLNAMRNQPRKKIDLTFRAFMEFAKGKPENVKLYAHMGVKDSSVDIVKLSERYGIDNRLIVTNLGKGPQQVPIENLNLIYNCTDIGVNTSVGEGFGLPSVEHAVTGAPQIVGNFSAMADLFKDCGLLVDSNMDFTLDNIMTTGKLLRPEDVAEKMELLYTNRDLYNNLSAKAKKKFTSKDFSWKRIASEWDNLFMEVLS